MVVYCELNNGVTLKMDGAPYTSLSEFLEMEATGPFAISYGGKREDVEPLRWWQEGGTD